MPQLTAKHFILEEQAFKHRTRDEINAIYWLTAQNESNPVIYGSMHTTDEAFIESMKKVDKIYAEHYDELKEYKNDNRVLQRKLEDIIFGNTIVKRTCEKLGMTYKELGEAIGYSEPAIKKVIQTEKVSEPMLKAISLYEETLELKNQLNNTNKLKEALKDLLN